MENLIKNLTTATNMREKAIPGSDEHHFLIWAIEKLVTKVNRKHRKLARKRKAHMQKKITIPKNEIRSLTSLKQEIELAEKKDKLILSRIEGLRKYLQEISASIQQVREYLNELKP